MAEDFESDSDESISAMFGIGKDDGNEGSKAAAEIAVPKNPISKKKGPMNLDERLDKGRVRGKLSFELAGMSGNDKAEKSERVAIRVPSNDDEEDEDEDEDDDDRALQKAFREGTLAGKTAYLQQGKTNFANDVTGLKKRLAEIKYPADFNWVQRLDVTSLKPVLIEDIENDQQRESAFYQQGLEAAQIGLQRLSEFGIPTERPDDYFAETVKSDDHMRKVRMRLIADREALSQSLNAKQQRKAKKFGKMTQQKVLKEREEEKKSSLAKIKRLRKGGVSQDQSDDPFDVTVKNDKTKRNKKKAPRVR